MKKMAFVFGFLIFSSCTQSKNEKTIAGIVFQNDLFMRMSQIGMENAGKDLNVNVLLGNSDNQIDKEAKLIDTYIARKVDAIVMMPLSAEGSQASLQRAKDANIKVILLNTTVNDSELYSSYISTENYDLGKASGMAAADFIKENFSGQEIKVATIAFRAQLPEYSDQRVNGFLDVVKNIPGVKIVAQQDSWLAEQAIKVMGDMLTANPDIKIIYSANEGGTVGAVQAVRNAGKAGKAFVFGTDGSDQIAQMLLSEDKVLQFAAAQKPVELGYMGIQKAVSLLNGQTIDKKLKVTTLDLNARNPEGVRAFQKEVAELSK